MKKLSLDKLKVESFVTSMNAETSETAKGGLEIIKFSFDVTACFCPLTREIACFTDPRQCFRTVDFRQCGTVDPRQCGTIVGCTF